jgi:hypothetical protein
MVPLFQKQKKATPPFRVQLSETAEIWEYYWIFTRRHVWPYPLKEHYALWIILSNICVVWLDI